MNSLFEDFHKMNRKNKLLNVNYYKLISDIPTEQSFINCLWSNLIFACNCYLIFSFVLSVSIRKCKFSTSSDYKIKNNKNVPFL